MSIKELFQQKIDLDAQLDKVVTDAIRDIDRKLWVVTGGYLNSNIVPYVPNGSKTIFDGDIPKEFSIESYSIREGKYLWIRWITYFRGETDDYGFFGIPIVYIDNPTFYRSALETKNAELAALAAEEDRLRVEQEAIELKNQLDKDRELLDSLLERRNKGEL